MSDLWRGLGAAWWDCEGYTVVGDRGGKTRRMRQDRLARVSDRTKWQAKLEEPWDPPLWRWSCGMKSDGLIWHMLRIWFVISIVVVEEW